MLVGQLLALSYLSRLYGPPPGSQPLGKVSAIYIGLFLCVSVVSTLVLPAAALGLSRALVLEELHLWRPWAWRAEEGRAGAGFALLEPARPLLLTQASLTQQKHDRNGSRDGQ